MTDAEHGTATISADGQGVLYTPASDYFGVDSFDYTITDSNGVSSTATVNLTITNVNDDPVAIDDVLEVDEDSIDVDLLVLANDHNAPDPPETLTIDSVGVPSAGGAVRISEDGTKLIFTPKPNYFGPESIIYTIVDGNGGTATATTVVNVADTVDPPQAIDDEYTIYFDGNTHTLDVLINDSILPDADEVLRIVGLTQPGGGSAVISEDEGSILFDPPLDAGTYSFTYTITDEEFDVTASVTVNVLLYHQNGNILDVNNDGFVTPLDALIVINEVNTNGSHALQLPPPEGSPDVYLDTSGDNTVSPLDALLVINYLNEPSAEGEGVASADRLAVPFAGSSNTSSSLQTHNAASLVATENETASSHVVRPVPLAVDRVFATTGTSHERQMNSEERLADALEDDELLTLIAEELLAQA